MYDVHVITVPALFQTAGTVEQVFNEHTVQFWTNNVVRGAFKNFIYFRQGQFRLRRNSTISDCIDFMDINHRSQNLLNTLEKTFPDVHHVSVNFTSLANASFVTESVGNYFPLDDATKIHRVSISIILKPSFYTRTFNVEENTFVLRCNTVKQFVQFVYGGELTSCVRLTCSKNDIIDIKTALLKTDKIYNVDVRLSSPICKSSCDFHIQINEPQQSLGVGALFHALQSTCLSEFSSDITLPSVDLVSLRTTSLCTPLSPYQNSKALNLSTGNYTRYKFVDTSGRESNCFFPFNHGTHVHMILSNLYVDGIYVSLETESSDNLVRLLYGSNFDPQFYGIDLKTCNSNMTSGVHSENTWNMKALASPLTLTSTQSYLIDENASNVSLLYEGKCESETKWLAVVVKETYTSHTAVLQSSNMNISFLHGSNVYTRFDIQQNPQRFCLQFSTIAIWKQCKSTESHQNLSNRFRRRRVYIHKKPQIYMLFIP